MEIKFALILLSVAAINAFIQPGDKIRGVNIGGWLVLEPWIRPSLFKQFENVPREQKAVDETQFNLRLGKQEAERQLKKHYEEWYTEDDFRQIKEAGLNIVRIPYGWWILGDSDQFVSGLSYLDKAIQWANKYELSVLLDLHGVPGSQNGYDNSGLQCASIVLDGDCVSPCPQDPLWPRSVKDMEYAVSVLTRIAIRYKDQPSIWGTELLNEPIARIPAEYIRQYYTMAYEALSKIVPHWKIVMHDNYRSYNWTDFMQDKSVYPQAMLDTHLYLCFENEFLVMTDEDKMLNKACEYRKQVDFMHNKELPTMVGEFSYAVDDCALHLNGFLQHTRKQDYLGLQCNEPRSQEFWVNLSKSYLNAIERGAGWIFWTWKNELEEDTEPQWSYRKAREYGWFPKDAKDTPDFIQGACQSQQNSK